MLTNEPLESLTNSGLACLQTMYEGERNRLYMSSLLNNRKLAVVKYELMSRNIHPRDNYPSERLTSLE